MVLYPADPGLRWNLAALMQVAGNLAIAEEQWRELMRLQPRSALPAYNLAKLLETEGSKEQARNLYEQARRLDPRVASMAAMDR